MRKTALALGFLFFGTFDASAQADPYAWCAEYGGGFGGSSNCYFVTLEQCRAALSGPGEMCRPNPFYTGRPAGRGDAHARRRSAH
jgi:hypothetical protein